MPKLGNNINVENMKNKLYYIVMSLLVFNILFTFYYYFRIVDFLYINLFKYSALINVILVNISLLLIDITYIFIYKLLKFDRFSYLKIVFIGVVLGCLFSVLYLGIKENEFRSYLAIVSFFTINTIFISYSLSFEEEKKRVFY